MTPPQISEDASPEGAAEGHSDQAATVTSDSPDVAMVNRRLIFSIVSMAIFMSTVDVTIVATALPAIHRDLHSTLSWSAWTITIYGLVQIIVLPIAGKLSNQFGQRRVFIVGVVLFTGASLLCGFATNIYVLVIFRAVQAFGGGSFTPSAAGIVSSLFGSGRDKALGLFQSVAAAGQVVGPLIGGVLVGYLSWRWIFFVNVPIGVVLLMLTVRYVPESIRVAGEKIDFAGLVLTATGMLALIIGITNLSNKGTEPYDATVLFPILLAVGLVVAVLRHAGRIELPFIPLRLLSGKGFGISNIQNFLFGATAFGVASLVPLYAEQRYHFHALDAGTLLSARAVAMVATSALASMTLRRTGYRLPMAVGFLVVAVGMSLLAIAPRWGISPYAWLSISAGITGLGIGYAGPAARNASLQLAPDQTSVIIGLRAMFVNLGVIVSIATTTAILNRSGDPGLVQSHGYWLVTAILVFVMTPIVFMIPNHKGSW